MINHKSKTLQFFYRGLIQLYKKPSHTPQGYILFLIISLSIALSGLLVAYALLAKVHSISVKSAANSNSGFYGAEGALNTRAELLRGIFINYLTPTGTAPTYLSACMDTDTTNNGSGHFACQSQTFAASDSSSNGITAYSYLVDSTSYQNGQPPTGTVPPGESFQNLNMLEYRYSINSVTQKANASSGQVTAMTNMAIKSRLVPMFQFAAFYLNDLEIVPGAAMNLNGPIHTNGNLHLGGTGANFLNINGQVTLSKNLYNSRKNNGETFPDGRVRIMNLAGTFLNLLFNGTNSTTPTAAAMNANRVATAWGSQVKLGIDALSIPTASVLNLNGDYSQKADLKILYTPAATSNTGNNATSPNPATVPFSITSIRRTSSGTVTSSTDLTEGELRSLRQPVLLDRTLSAVTGTYNFCTPATAVSPGVTLTAAQNEGVVDALAVAIASQTTPLAFNSANTAFSTYAINARLLPASSPPALNTALNTTLGSIIDTVFASSLDSTQRTTLKTNLAAATPAEIAALDGRCFIGAPLEDIGRDASAHNSPYRFYNDREGRDIRLLQINIRSLTAWNKVGVYVTFNNGSVDNNSVLSLGSLPDPLKRQRLFATAPADNGAPADSFQNLGLAGSDTTEAGFVFHATINTATYPNGAGNDSPYGFALVQAQQLPGLATTTTTSDPTGLTFVSDQAVYVQGDYNTLNWQPASILADSLNVLSNTCINTDGVIHKLSGANCNTIPDGTDSGTDPDKIAPTATTINTAFLAGTDITNSTAAPGYNGGLENYPRFLEGWGGITLTYRGSFVSTSTPVHVSGTWSNQAYGAPGRNWDYDTRFNSAQNLPPLAPRFVYLKQESFTRNYNQ